MGVSSVMLAGSLVVGVEVWCGVQLGPGSRVGVGVGTDV